MKNLKYKSNSGFTLVEFIIAIVIFSTIVVSYLAAMYVLFNNSSKQMDFTKGLYDIQKNIETASAIINDEELEPKEKLDDTVRKEIIKESGIDPKYTSSFNVFSGEYKTEVDGYFLTSQADITDGKLYLFLSNDNTSEITMPKVINQYIKGISIDSAYRDTNTFNGPEFIYRDMEMLRDTNNPMSRYYRDNGHVYYGIELYYDFEDGTDINSFYERFRWQYCTNIGGENIEPVLRSYNRNQIPDISMGKAYPASPKDYTIVDKVPMKSLTASDINTYFNVKNDKNVAVDYYLMSKIMPQTLTNISVPESYSHPVWVINLPTTRNLALHIDPSLEGPYIGSGTCNVPYLRNLMTVFNNTDLAKNVCKRLTRIDGNMITLGKDDDYGKYFTLSNDLRNGLSYIPSRADNGSGETTLFLVVGTDSTTNGGPIILRPADPTRSAFYKIDYDPVKGFGVMGGTYSSEAATKLLIKGNPASNKHIIIFTENVDWMSRTNYLAVDSPRLQSKVQRSWPRPVVRGTNPLYIGGAQGLKVYEVIEYDKVLNGRTIEDTFNYLKNKHKITY